MSDNCILEVVIPAFNSQNFISETLESIFKQKTNFDFSVHVSDDCSKDSTAQICEMFQERHPNLKITRQRVNLGMSKNQHFVITSAQTKYIAYIDSDDVFISDNYLQCQIDFLESNEDVGCVFSNVMNFSDQENSNEIKFNSNKKPPIKFDLHYYFKNGIPITNSAMVFRQKFNYNIPQSFTNYFQYDWLLHIHHGLNSLFGYNDFVGTKYRIHSNNATNIKFAEKKFKDAIELVYNVKKYLPSEYHVYFNHPLFELNSLALFYLRERKILGFLKFYYKWFKCIHIKEINFRDQFWLFRQALFRR